MLAILFKHQAAPSFFQSDPFKANPQTLRPSDAGMAAVQLLPPKLVFQFTGWSFMVNLCCKAIRCTQESRAFAQSWCRGPDPCKMPVTAGTSLCMHLVNSTRCPRARSVCLPSRPSSLLCQSSATSLAAPCARQAWQCGMPLQAGDSFIIALGPMARRCPCLC